MNSTIRLVSLFTAGCALSAATSPRLGAITTAGDTAKANQPDWLSDASLAVRESYDDNVLGVSGNGLPVQSSWVTAASLKLGFNLRPWLSNQPAIQTLALTYQPDVVSYANASAENYTAHRINTTLRGKSDDVAFSLDNAYLFNDGSKVGATYALNQLAGAAANQNDKYRNFYAQAPVRERRGQVQDRSTVQLQYSVGNFFVRPVSAFLYYNLHTAQYNTSAAPYKGYQDWVDRSDLNGGVDCGYKVTPDVAVTLGYRDGYQFQQQFTPAVSSDQHFSSSHYQRVLLGLDGKLASWLTVKLAAGPDFRDYNANAPVNNLKPDTFFGEAAAVLTITAHQSVTCNFKQWVFVSSTGLAPYDDITYALNYHWSASARWGFDLGAKYLEANYGMGNDLAGSAPSLRDDLDTVLSFGASYAFTPRFGVSLTYNHERARNGVKGLAATYQEAYRDFDHQITGLSAQFKF